MPAVTYLGFVAARCTTFAFLPQVLKVWRTRSTMAFCLETFLILTLGIVLWLIYGVIQADVPIATASGVPLILAATILYFNPTPRIDRARPDSKRAAGHD